MSEYLVMVSVCQNELGNILQERILIHIFLECIDSLLIHAISRDAIIEQQSQFLIGQLRLDKNSNNQWQHPFVFHLPIDE